MARSDEFFTPESIDEQIELYSRVSGGDYAKYNEVLNAHLMHQLHSHYQQDAAEKQQHLEDAWHQIAQHRKQARRNEYNGRAGPAEPEIRDHWQDRHHQQLHQTFLQPQTQQEKPGRSFGRLVLMVTIVLLLCLLVAIAVAILSQMQ